MKWVTRERPKIDRIACPWLIARFIDKEPEFLFVPADRVLPLAERTGAIPYDIPGVRLGCAGKECTFDAFLSEYGLDETALLRLADIIRDADPSRLEFSPQSPGLFAISDGLGHVYPYDHELLRHGLMICDALYAWCRHLQSEMGPGEMHSATEATA